MLQFLHYSNKDIKDRNELKTQLSGAATVTLKGSDGKSVQVPQAVITQAQLGLVQPGPDGTITVPGSDGKPVKISQTALAAAAPAVLSNMTGGSIQNKRHL